MHCDKAQHLQPRVKSRLLHPSQCIQPCSDEMARPAVQDDEDEFGWDLSLEDELLLSNIADHAQDPARRPRSSSAGSETTITTITTVDQRATAKRLLPARTSKTVPNLQADITAAFPASPWTEAIDIDSVADTASIGPRLGYDDGAQTSRFGGFNGQRRVNSGSIVSNISDQSAEFASGKPADVRYPDCMSTVTFHSYLPKNLPKENHATIANF